MKTSVHKPYQVFKSISTINNCCKVKSDGDDAASSPFVNHFKGQKARDAPGKNSSRVQRANSHFHYNSINKNCKFLLASFLLSRRRLRGS